MEHRFEGETGRLFIQMPKEVDHHFAEQLRRETDSLMNRYPVRSLVFDFRKTIFKDSSGIGVILGRCRNLKFAGGQAAAINLNSQIQRIFQVSGLHKLINVE